MNTRTISTPVGPARTHSFGPADSDTTVMLSHGAGGGIEARDLVALRDGLVEADYRVVLLEQPWRIAGKKVAPAPTTLDRATTAVIENLSKGSDTQLVLGGRSAGARVACRLAANLPTELVPVGLLLTAFPLHAPGKPEKTRIDELAAVKIPVFIGQGSRDPFGTSDELSQASRSSPFVTVVDVPQGDHGLAVPKRAELDQEETLTLLVTQALDWLNAQCRN